MTRALKHYFENRSSPRSILTLVIGLTGMAGFGFSYCLLKWGMTPMWLRYPIAVSGAYAVFLGLIAVWVEFERWRFDPNDPELVRAMKNGAEPCASATLRKESSWSRCLDGLDFPTELDVGGCLPVLLFGLFLGLVVLILAVIGEAPILIAEVFVDAFLTGLLYRRLKTAAAEQWLGTAVRKTWLYVLGTALLLGVAGLCLDRMAPESDSMGKAIKEVLRRR